MTVSQSRQRVVIVGAGKAGTRVAAELRALGYGGAIALFDAEPHSPYDRPPLSKDFLQTGTDTPNIDLFPEVFYRDNRIDLHTGVAVTAVDRSKQVVRYDQNELAYDALVLATGATAKRLSVAGHTLFGVYYLRTLNQAQLLRGVLRTARHLVVVGAGFIGLEIAASAVALGCQVTVVESSNVAMGRAVPRSLAERVLTEHRRRGVRVLLNAQVQAFIGNPHVTEVTLADGQLLSCDAVVVGVGAAPVTALAVAADLACDDGIFVNAYFRTSDPHIYAVGDVCRFPTSNGKLWERLESWRSADEQASYVARVLMGDTEPFHSLPFFWSDQFDLTLQIVGHPALGVQTVVRNLADDAVIEFFVNADGRLVAACAWGALAYIGKEIRAAEHLIRRARIVQLADLNNPAVSLKNLLKG